jgi:RHS repeat-associated protein
MGEDQTDADGDITDKYAYDAYGSLLSHDCYSGSVSQPYQYVGQLGYYTHYTEPEFGLLQLGVRFYDAEVGRFTQADVVRQLDSSSYSYAACSPPAEVDPDGRRAVAPSDPRFPKKPCQASWLTLCRNKKCLQDSVTNTYRILRRHYPKVKRGELNGPQDAFRHCVWACLVRKTCGAAAYGAVEDHENDDCKGAKGHWDPIGSPMDLANDGEGESCAGAGGSCESCCADKLHKGDLYILPPRYWK